MPPSAPAAMENYESEDDSHLAAGMVRALRALIRPSKLKLPRVRVGKFANRGSNVLDTLQVFKDRAEIQVNNRESRVRDVLRQELKKGGMRSVTRHLLLPLVLNTALGTAMFDVYENVTMRMMQPEHKEVSPWYSGVQGFCGGLCAGAFFGAGSQICNTALETKLVEPLHTTLRAISSSAAMEAPSCALWLGAYCMSKDWMALNLNETSVASNELSALHLGIVSVAGAGSGVLQTASAHALETRALTVPPLGVLVRAIPLSVLTFWALEYG